MIDCPGWIESRRWSRGGAPPGSFHAGQKKRPIGIVVHSGDSHARVAESILEDGRGVSYHFAWSAGEGRIVQLVSCGDRAYHAGAEGNGAIGIALPGPWSEEPRTDAERDDFRALVIELQGLFEGTLRRYCRHSDITPGKRDPGPGFLPEWIEILGFVHDPRGANFWS